MLLTFIMVKYTIIFIDTHLEEVIIMYTFKITDKNGECKEYNHIVKVCYTVPVPGAKETVIEGEDIFTYQYKTCYDLHLYAEKEAFTVSNREISVINVVKEY